MARKFKKKVVKRERKRGGKSAWKDLERRVAEYFNTSRAPIGQKGHDLREVPVVEEWLKSKAPKLAPGPVHGRIFVECKGRGVDLPLLERWHAHVLGSKEGRIPLFVIDGKEDENTIFVGCLLKHLPFAYRLLVRQRVNVKRNAWAFISRMSIGVCRVSTSFNRLQSYYTQVDENAKIWGEKNNVDPVNIWKIVALHYPKRVSELILFRLIHPAFETELGP